MINIKDIKTVYINPYEGKYIERGDYVYNFLKNVIGIKNVVHYKSSICTDYGKELKIITSKILEDHCDDEPILIVEDDIALTEWYRDKNTDDINIEIPEFADALYLGNHRFGMHDYDDKLYFPLNINAKHNLKYYSKSVCRIFNMLSAHAIIYKSKRYKESVIQLFKEPTSIMNDALLARNIKHYLVYAYRKPIFYQKQEFSNYSMEWVTHYELDDELLDVKKFLIYFTVGGADDYIKLTKCCIESIRKTNSYNSFDIMIMCDKNYKKHIDYNIDNVDIMITDDNSTVEQVSMRKVEIFSYPKIWMYEKVLYLDCDIIVNGNLKLLFDKVVENKLYIKKDPIEIFEPRYYINRELLDSDIKKLNDNNLWFFNAGQFLFQVSTEMENHFKNILYNIRNHVGSFFYEQSFMNEYFLDNMQVVSDSFIEDNIKVNCILDNSVKENFIIIHFSCSVIPYYVKYDHMLECLNQIVHLFDNRNDMIKHYIKENCNIAEIGVFKGSFSKILYQTKPSKLDLIDLWEGMLMSGNEDGNNIIYTDSNTALSEVNDMFKDSENVSIIKCDSVTYLNKLEDNFYDAIYLDGDHSYYGVKRDIEICFKKVKKGGYIMGHDYEMNYYKTSNVYNFGVKQAVDEFCLKYNQKIIAKALDGCVSFCIQVQK